jgi:hypothetical protein
VYAKQRRRAFLAHRPKHRGYRTNNSGPLVWRCQARRERRNTGLADEEARPSHLSGLECRSCLTKDTSSTPRGGHETTGIDNDLLTARSPALLEARYVRDRVTIPVTLHRPGKTAVSRIRVIRRSLGEMYRGDALHHYRVASASSDMEYPRRRHQFPPFPRKELWTSRDVFGVRHLYPSASCDKLLR